MSEPLDSHNLPDLSSGDPGIDRCITEMLDSLAPTDDRDLLTAILVEGIRLASIATDRLNLKIAAAALREMREAFAAFAPYRDRRKVTVFGSARTTEDNPLYSQAIALTARLADAGWMVVTGAGPGIMHAAMEGAGRENSFGVRIRLPFEADANEVIAGDSKLVSMKYFFTRKLMLMKESAAFVSLPGGFGTLDEVFELLTLQQTGKAVPAPTVLLDVVGGSFWTSWRSFMENEVSPLGLISPGDLDLAPITDNVEAAFDHIEGFYRNYHSIRWVGNRLVVRMLHAPTNDQLRALNERFGSLCLDDRGIAATNPLRPEVADDDHLSLARIVLTLDHHQVAHLHTLIGALNSLEKL